MKAILLAAGRGSRLDALTDDKPKCMVEFREKPIIDHILATMDSCGIHKVSVVDGYQKNVLREYLSNRPITFYSNDDYLQTNMVHSLFCASQEFDDDLIISYSDIIYTPAVLQKIVSDTSPISLVIDKGWQKLWEYRMDNPLADVETLKLNENNEILELGKKPGSLEEIEGQYIGLIKISKDMLGVVHDFYESLDQSKEYDGKSFQNMYMTSFFQMILEKVCPLKAVLINGGWLEIDTAEDLNAYKENDSSLGL
ncbi:MAG: choline kinase [Chlamydiales bacterium]|jgi:choline kinase